MSNDVPGWTDDGTLSWSPERALAFTAVAESVPTVTMAGPWSPKPLAEIRAESVRAHYWPWRIGIGLAQGFFFFLLFHSRALNQWPGNDPFLFDAAALAGLFAPLLLLEGLGRIALIRLLPFTGIATAILAGLGWYHRWRIFGMNESHAGISLLMLSAIALFVAQAFLHARQAGGGWRIAYADLFTQSWTLAARLAVWLLLAGLGLALLHSPLVPRLTLEDGDLVAMPLLGLFSALAFQLTAAVPRVTTALKDALVATATIALPLAVTTALLLISTAPAQGPAALIFLLAVMAGLTLCISASQRAGATEGRRAWRDGFEIFGSALLLILSGMAIWTLDQRVARLGWTSARLFAACAAALLAAYGAGYCAAAATGLLRGGGLKRLEGVNIALGVVLMLGCLALASPLADPLRLAALTQAARLEQGRVTPEAFDFANLERDGARFGREALSGLTHNLYPDIARAASAVRGAVRDPLNPTEIGANIAVRTPGAALPAALLARDWRPVSGVPPCLTQAAQSCEAYFLDLNQDGRSEILLVSGNEARWWGAVMEADEAGRWRMAGRLTAGCGATLSDLRAGRLSALPALPGWGDLSVAGRRLPVTPSGTGCSHY